MRALEAVLAERAAPDEDLVLGDQHVGDAVAVHVEEAQVRVGGIEVGHAGEGVERRPAVRLRLALEEAARGPAEEHEIHLPVRVEAREQLSGRAERGDVGLGAHDVGASQVAAAVVALVEERTALLREHAGDALAVEIEPAVLGPINAALHVDDAVRDEHVHGRLQVRPRVIQVEPRHRRLRVA